VTTVDLTVSFSRSISGIFTMNFNYIKMEMGESSSTQLYMFEPFLY
jgi:hypothetical protein